MSEHPLPSPRSRPIRALCAARGAGIFDRPHPLCERSHVVGAGYRRPTRRIFAGRLMRSSPQPPVRWPKRAGIFGAIGHGSPLQLE
jgi:hypothetical protein